jgi:hypothetical protein
MSGYHDLGFRIDSENRIIDEVVTYVNMLDSSMPPRNAPLPTIHKRVAQRWKISSARHEPLNLRSRWIWQDGQWKPINQ